MLQLHCLLILWPVLLWCPGSTACISCSRGFIASIALFLVAVVTGPAVVVVVAMASWGISLLHHFLGKLRLLAVHGCLVLVGSTVKTVGLGVIQKPVHV